MKKTFFLILSLISVCLFAQKNDFKWLLGYHFVNDNDPDTTWGTTVVDFDTPDGNPSMRSDKRKKIDFLITEALICDDNGNYLFSTNGAFVEDSSGNLMENADELSHDGRVYPHFGETIEQGALILPYPGKRDRYILFHKTIIDFLDYGAATNELFYSLIEISAKYPKGKMIKRPTSLLKDTLSASCLISVKHANGRDWWVVVSEDNALGYYVYLVSPAGISLYKKQTFPGVKLGGGFGQSFFSNDGKYFVTATSDDDGYGKHNDNLYFFNFDRCNGELSRFNYYISFPNAKRIWATGCAFSPNNKYLYAATLDTMYRFTLSNGKIRRWEKIAQYDGFQEEVIQNGTFDTEFGMLQQAPDGRIYGMCPECSYRFLDVINEPDDSINYDFRPHSLKSITTKLTLPNFPNFRLGPIDGSVCDSLGIDNIPWCWWRYNQDTSDYLKFKFTDLSAYEVKEWFWDFGDTKSGELNNSMLVSPSHKFSSNGKYNVCLVVKNMYGMDTLCRTIKIGNVVSTKDELNIPEFQLWPNPCKDYFVVNVSEYNPEKMQLHLYDALGNQLLTEKLYQGTNLIQAGSLPSGIFLVTIFEKDKEVFSESLLKL